MSRLKNMPAIGWLVVGIAIAVLAIPTVAGAKVALKFTGIEGTSGNKADVTSAGQLEVAPANPASLFQNQYTVNSGGDTLSTVAQPPTGDALVVEDVHLAVEVLSNGDVPMYLTVHTGATCSTGSLVPGLNQPLYATALGDTDDPLTPGVVVPSGDTLCLQVYGTESDIVVAATASGYTIPAADAS
jgi:hypothetical protein